MPAVALNQLKSQINQLLWLFTRPEEFRAGLKNMLDGLANRALRPSQATQKYGGMPAHQVSPLVMQQLQQQILPLLMENPAAGLALTDALWQDEYLEPRQLAAYILGQVPLTPPEQVTSRLLAWCRPDTERVLQYELLRQGSARLRREQPSSWLQMVTAWLSAADMQNQRLGLRAVTALAEDRSFENIPPMFSLVLSLILSSAAQLSADLEEVLVALARRSPAETVYLLRQALASRPSPPIQRLARRILPVFEPEQQAALRRLL